MQRKTGSGSQRWKNVGKRVGEEMTWQGLVQLGGEGPTRMGLPEGKGRWL